MQAIICPGHTRPIVDLQFSDIVPDTGLYFLVSACKDGKPMLRLGSTGDWIGTYEGHKGAVNCAGINSRAQVAATGSADFTAKLWDPLKGTVVSTMTHDHVVRALDLGNFQDSSALTNGDHSVSSSKPTHLVTATTNKYIWLWDNQRPDAFVCKMSGHSNNIRKVIWLPDGHRCFSVAEDKQLRVWDLRTAECIETVDMEEFATDVDIEYSHRRNCFLTRGKYAVEVDLTQSHLNESVNHTGKRVPLPAGVLTASRYPSHIPMPTLNGDSDGDKESSSQDPIFVCAGTDNTVYKCSLHTGDIIEKYAKVHCGAINCIRFSPDGHLYATASDDGTLRLFQTCVGETYGLWRRVEKTGADGDSNETSS